jgi:hypothetical protein
VKEIEFRNSSEFDVSDIKGHITLWSSDRQPLGSIQFVATGFVYAGGVATLGAKSIEVVSKAERFEIVVDEVHVWN